MVFIAEMLQKQMPSWKGRGLKGSGPGVQRSGKLFFGGWKVRGRKGGLDPVSEKRLNIRMGKEIRLTLAW